MWASGGDRHDVIRAMCESGGDRHTVIRAMCESGGDRNVVICDRCESRCDRYRMQPARRERAHARAHDGYAYTPDASQMSRARSMMSRVRNMRRLGDLARELTTVTLAIAMRSQMSHVQLAAHDGHACIGNALQNAAHTACKV